MPCPFRHKFGAGFLDGKPAWAFFALRYIDAGCALVRRVEHRTQTRRGQEVAQSLGLVALRLDEQPLAADLVGWSPQLGDMLDAGNGEGLFALAVARQGSVNLGIDDNALCDTVTLLLALSQLLRDVGLPTALA